MASPAEARIPAGAHAMDLPPDHVYFGPSETMQAVRRKVDRASGLNVPILILGESGTGKEILARFIHNRSRGRFASHSPRSSQARYSSTTSSTSVSYETCKLSVLLTPPDFL